MQLVKYVAARACYPLSLSAIYVSYLSLIVEYSSVVWDGFSEQDSQTLRKIQNEAAQIVTGLTRSVSLETLYKECGCATLYQNRQQHKPSFIYNVNSGMVPSYIQDWSRFNSSFS